MSLRHRYPAAPRCSTARTLVALAGTVVLVLVGATCGDRQPTEPNQQRPGASLPPVASYTMLTQGPVAKSLVTVDGSASSDPNAGGSITDYSWNWGDGNTYSSGTASKAVHTYDLPGSYTLALTVTNTAGLTNTASQTITVAARDTFTFSFSPTTPAAGQATAFTAVNAAEPTG